MFTSRRACWHAVQGFSRCGVSPRHRMILANTAKQTSFAVPETSALKLLLVIVSLPGLFLIQVAFCSSFPRVNCVLHRTFFPSSSQGSLPISSPVREMNTDEVSEMQHPNVEHGTGTAANSTEISKVPSSQLDASRTTYEHWRCRANIDAEIHQLPAHNCI